MARYTAVDLGEDVAYSLSPADADTQFSGASALAGADGQVTLYLCAQSGSDGPRVVRTSAADGISFAAPTVVLSDACAPAVASDPRDPTVRWMAYERPTTGTIAIARSGDRGQSWVAAVDDVAPADGNETVSSPSLVVSEAAGFELFVTRTTPEGQSVITRSIGPSPEALSRADLALGPGTDCTEDDAPTPCWDAAGPRDAEVRRAVNGAGRALYRMFYRSGRDLGFASSYDGTTWSRFPFNPSVAPLGAHDGATNVLTAEGYLLLWAEVRSSTSHGVVIWEHPTTAPADRF